MRHSYLSDSQAPYSRHRCHWPLSYTKTTHPLTVHLLDQSTIQSTHTAQLQMPTNHLPKTATTAHIFPSLQNSLVSVGKLCDHGCTAHFTKDATIIQYQGHDVLRGNRSTNGLWTLLPSFKNAASSKYSYQNTPSHQRPSQILARRMFQPRPINLVSCHQK